MRDVVSAQCVCVTYAHGYLELTAYFIHLCIHMCPVAEIQRQRHGETDPSLRDGVGPRRNQHLPKYTAFRLTTECF